MFGSLLEVFIEILVKICFLFNLRRVKQRTPLIINTPAPPISHTKAHLRHTLKDTCTDTHTHSSTYTTIATNGHNQCNQCIQQLQPMHTTNATNAYINCNQLIDSMFVAFDAVTLWDVCNDYMCCKHRIQTS